MKTILLFPLAILMMVSLLSVWYSRRWRSLAQANEPDATLAAKFTIIKKSSLNDWQITPQRDDRKPTLVMRQQLSGFTSADRSTLRRSQQRMYRQWSSERHD